MIYAVTLVGHRVAVHFVHFVETRYAPRHYAGYVEFSKKGMRRRGVRPIDEVWSGRREDIEGFIVRDFERSRGGCFPSKLFGYKETPDGLCS